MLLYLVFLLLRFSYEPYSAKPTFLYTNVPLFVTGYCGAYGSAFGLRHLYVKFMSRYIK